ncbi:MAG: glycosyltransferase family 39 protein [Candidatus Levyibacteriota bacterium]
MSTKVIKSITFLKDHWFGACVILVILLSVILRFYNYDNRWSLAHDQARDALIGREALRQHKIPTLGPFTSQSAFVMGPIWYWLVAVATILYPWSILTPWIVLSLSYVLVVYLMILIGKELGGKRLGLVVGLLAAISPSQIAQSVDLTNPSGVSIFSALAIYFSIRYIKTKRNLYLFLFPFFIAMAINIHLQAIGLVSLILVSIILQRPGKKGLAALFSGFVLPFLPLIVFDLKHNFYNLRSLIDYYLYGQYRIYVPNRWLTYAGSYWPSAWGHIIGGQTILGYISIFLISIFTVYSTVQRKMTRPLLLIILSFLLIFILLRFYRGERLDSYLIFVNPLVIILTGWVTYSLFKFKRILGLLLFIFLLIGSISKDISNILNSTNYASYQARHWEKVLTKLYPHEKFKVYDYERKFGYATLPLSLYLDFNSKIDDNGMAVGIGVITDTKSTYPRILDDQGGWIYDLSGSSSAELAKAKWFLVNPSSIYKATEEWYFGKDL